MNLTPRRSQRRSGSVSQPAGAALRTLILLWAAAQVAVAGLPEPGLHDLDALEAKRSVFYPPPGFMGDHRPGAVIHLAPPLLPTAHGNSWYLWGGSDKFEVSLQRQLESRKGDGPMTTALSSASMWKLHGTGVLARFPGKAKSLLHPVLLAIVPPEQRGWSYYEPADEVLIDVPLAPTVVAPATTAEYYVMGAAARTSGRQPAAAAAPHQRGAGGPAHPRGTRGALRGGGRGEGLGGRLRHAGERRRVPQVRARGQP